MTQVLPFVERVVEVTDGRLTAAKILDRVLTGKVNLWIVYDDETLKFYGFMNLGLKIGSISVGKIWSCWGI